MIITNELIQELFNILIASYKENFTNEKMTNDFIRNLKFTTGNKYIKITTGNSVYCFIVDIPNDKKFPKGTILKPASFNSPTRNFSRGNIFALDKCKKNLRWNGL